MADMQATLTARLPGAPQLSVEVTAVKAVSYTCAKHSSLQTVDGATGVVGGGHTMHTYT